MKAIGLETESIGPHHHQAETRGRSVWAAFVAGPGYFFLAMVLILAGFVVRTAEKRVENLEGMAGNHDRQLAVLATELTAMQRQLQRIETLLLQKLGKN